MRTSCLDCARKHVAQSIVLGCEMDKGYPQHKWLAIGHLAEAEDELILEYPEVANMVRDSRLAIMDGKREDLMPLIDFISSYEEVPDAVS